MVFNNVDFPHPDGPNKTRKSPSLISKLIPFKTSVDPKFLLMSFIFKFAILLSFH